MDMERAKEIMEAPGIIKVTMDGKPVWIDRLDPQRQSVAVHAENDPSDVHWVKAEQLHEIG